MADSIKEWRKARMPHYNIKHKSKYYVFSTISGSIIYEFDTFDELQKYRLEEYGKSNFEDEKTFEELRANKMELKETILSMIFSGNVANREITKYYMLLDDVDKEEVFYDLIIEYKEESKK